jgi:hypothetical protein
MPAELVQMFVGPTESYLQCLVQIRNRAVTAHQQAPPDQWADLKNRHMRLTDFNLGPGR